MSSISALFKNNPVKRDRIIPLDFSYTPALPESHVWTPQTSPVDPLTPEQVPVIDLRNPDRNTLIRRACEKWGAFQITGHGVPSSLLSQVENQSRRLFCLPLKRKLLAVRSPDEPVGYGMVRISTFFDKLMWSEGFSIIGSPSRQTALLWSNDYAQFCTAMEEYQKAMEVLSCKLLSLMLKSLGLSHKDIKWLKPDKTGTKPETQNLLQLNSYPVCPEPERAMGLAPHTDSSLFTILYQGNISGLQIQRPGNSPGWVSVNPVNNALVVNVGDLLHIISNGRFRSTLHRVVVNNTHHRISAAYFFGPPKNIKIVPPVKLTSAGQPSVYRELTWDEYLEAKATHFTKALELFRC